MPLWSQPSPRQGEKVLCHGASRCRVEDDSTGDSLLARKCSAPCLKASKIKVAHLRSQLDFESNGHVVLFQNEVHFPTRTVAPKVMASATRIQLPPGLQ